MSVGFTPQIYFESHHPSVAEPITPQDLLVTLRDLCDWLNLDRVVGKLWDVLPPIVRDASAFTYFEAVNTIVMLQALEERLGSKRFALMDRAIYSLNMRISHAIRSFLTFEDFIEYYDALHPESVYSAVLNQEEFRSLAHTNLKETLRSMQLDQYIEFLMNILTTDTPSQFKTDVIEIHKLLIQTNQVYITLNQAQLLAHTIAKVQNSHIPKFHLPIPTHPTEDFIPYGYFPQFPDPRMFAIRSIP